MAARTARRRCLSWGLIIIGPPAVRPYAASDVSRGPAHLAPQVLATCAGLEAQRFAALESVAASVQTWKGAARRLEAALEAERARANAAAARAALAEEAAAAATAEAAAQYDGRRPHGPAAVPDGELARLRCEVLALRAELEAERERASLMADGAAALRAQLQGSGFGAADAAQAVPPAAADAGELVALRCALEAERARADAAAAREAAGAASAARGAAAAASDAPRAAELALALAAEQARSKKLAAALKAASPPDGTKPAFAGALGAGGESVFLSPLKGGPRAESPSCTGSPGLADDAEEEAAGALRRALFVACRRPAAVAPPVTPGESSEEE